MEISNRLTAIANMVTKGNVVCDVGTDHGYLAIYLVEKGISDKVIAMDVAKGPLGKAQSNIALYGMEPAIETRLSDGVDKLGDNEAGTVIMAGMGGILICGLLEKGIKKLTAVDELILSPHTDIRLVREFLIQHGFCIVDEEMLQEEGKYYVIIKARSGRSESYDKCQLTYGKCLLHNKNITLKKYLTEELDKQTKLMDKLNCVDTESANIRRNELKIEIQNVKEGLGYYEL